MKQLVQIFFILFSIMAANCVKEEKNVNDIPENELVEAYVQISLIYESQRGLAEKDARVAIYLKDNNLSKQKIDRMLDKYKSNPNEWRGFFMKVQTRLRELEARQRSITIAEESVKIIETEEQISIEPDLAAIVDTLIVGTNKDDSAEKLIVEKIRTPDSTEKPTELTFGLPADEITEVVTTITPSAEEVDEVIPKYSEPKETITEEGLGFVYYKIKSGDNLSSLAKEHNSKTAQLMLVNSLENANSIKIGQTLLIPNDLTMILLHIISAGEALSKISSRYDSNLDLLIEINKIRDIHSIKAGDLLYIPVLKGETKDE